MGKYELWVNIITDRQTNTDTNTHTQTHRHINIITQPGLGAGPSENQL